MKRREVRREATKKRRQDENIGETSWICLCINVCAWKTACEDCRSGQERRREMRKSEDRIK